MGYILLRLSLNTEILSLNIVLEYQNIILEYQQVASLKHLAGLVAEERQQQLISGEVLFFSWWRFGFFLIRYAFLKITGAPSAFYCWWPFFCSNRVTCLRNVRLLRWHLYQSESHQLSLQSISESIIAGQWTNLGLIKRSVVRISGTKPNSE